MSVDTKFTTADTILVRAASDWLDGFKDLSRQQAEVELPKWRYYAALEHADLVGRVLDHFESAPEPVAGKDFLPTIEDQIREWLAANGMAVPADEPVPAAGRAAYWAAMEVGS